VFEHLQIADRRERLAVGIADLALAAAAPLVRLASHGRRESARPSILLLRLERIGDLVMALDAVRAVRLLAPEATIDLVVGSWNEGLARLVGGIDRVETLDARWLARGAGGVGWRQLVGRARQWRRRRYDLAINFEGDVRSHALLAVSGAPTRVGFEMAGGGPLLTVRVPHDPKRHVADNALRLVAAAFGLDEAALCEKAAQAGVLRQGLTPPADARAHAARLLAASGVRVGTDAGPLVGLHASGGREVKQWDLGRLAEVGRRLVEVRGAQLVLTGSEGDRPVVDRLRTSLGAGLPVVDLSGSHDVVVMAAVLERLALFVTPDTGPMHLADAVGTPLVAIHGPSDPARWGPRSSGARVVRVDLWCSPCNRIRRPPDRCVGHLPDCLAAVTVDAVLAAAVEQIDSGRRRTREGSDGVRDAD